MPKSTKKIAATQKSKKALEIIKKSIGGVATEDKETGAVVVVVKTTPLGLTKLWEIKFHFLNPKGMSSGNINLPSIGIPLKNSTLRMHCQTLFPPEVHVTIQYGLSKNKYRMAQVIELGDKLQETFPYPRPDYLPLVERLTMIDRYEMGCFFGGAATLVVNYHGGEISELYLDRPSIHYTIADLYKNIAEEEQEEKDIEMMADANSNNPLVIAWLEKCLKKLVWIDEPEEKPEDLQMVKVVEDTQKPVKGKTDMLPVEIKSAVNAIVPKGVSHVGIVVKNLAGGFLVLQPQVPQYGVTATLPRIKAQAEEEPARTLDRCLSEKVGTPTLSAYPIMNVWTTENSSTFYFVGMVQEEIVTRIKCFEWCNLDEAEALLRSSKNPTSRNRDIAVLKSASEINPSPFRRILLMLRELHGMGFGRLRAACLLSLHGQWSCSIVPATVMIENRGAYKNCQLEDRLRHSLGISKNQENDPFEALGNQQPFQWLDAAFDSPRQLADKFASRFRELCYTGWGTDRAYEQWFDEMLDKTAPHGVFYPVVDDAEFVRTAYAATELRIVVPPAIGR